MRKLAGMAPELKDKPDQPSFGTKDDPTQNSYVSDAVKFRVKAEKALESQTKIDYDAVYSPRRYRNIKAKVHTNTANGQY